jgi:hypothetical protein
MTTTIPTPAQLLNRAADILDERGWFQGNYVGATGCVCALGARHLAVTELDGNPTRATFATGAEFETALDRIYGALQTDSTDGIADWNDAEGRTKEEVQELLRRAAKAGES